MSANSEMAAYLRSEAAKVNPDEYVPLFHPLVIELAKGLEADDEKIAGLEAKVAELTEIVESVRHIGNLKTFFNSKVQKLKAMNRRLR